MNFKGVLFFTVFLMFIFHFNGNYSQNKLWYNQPAKEWTEALPVGNGRLGAMVFGNPDTERIQFNEESFN
ncbi:MAG: glycoside hydrolase N-terminal domain-containing protein [Bacteroidales bacterium]